MEPVSNVQVIAEALAAHRDSLVEGGVTQLTELWSRELDGVSPAVAKEVCASRLQSDQWAHFRKGGQAAPPAQQQQQAPAPVVGVAGPRAAELIAGMERMDAAFKAQVGAGQLGGAPGLAGNYR